MAMLGLGHFIRSSHENNQIGSHFAGRHFFKTHLAVTGSVNDLLYHRRHYLPQNDGLNQRVALKRYFVIYGKAFRTDEPNPRDGGFASLRTSFVIFW